MSTLEHRVRNALRAESETVRPDSIPAGPPPRQARPAQGLPGSRRARVLIPLGAAAAVIGIVASLSLAAPQLLSGGRPASGPSGSAATGPLLPTPGQPPPHLGPVPLPVLAAGASRGVPASAPAPGVPQFYVTAYNAPVGPVNYMVIQDTATGQVAARINPPAGDFFAAVAAPSGDRTFVTAVEPDTGCSSSQLYQFQLNDQGQPGPLVPLHITVPGNDGTVGGLTITPDGGTIGYATYLCGTGESEVGVIHLAAGQARVWSDDGVPGAMSLSLSADGRLLAYTKFGQGTSVLPTSAPSGPLAASSRVVSRTMTWAAIAPDDQAIYGCAVTPNPGTVVPQFSTSGPTLPQALPSIQARPSTGGEASDLGTLSYGRVSLTGGGVHVIASWANVTGPQCYASMDPAGNYLLVQFPTVADGTDDWSRPAILDLATGRLTYINAPAFYGPFDIAW
jgi:hypothetical protein